MTCEAWPCAPCSPWCISASQLVESEVDRACLVLPLCKRVTQRPFQESDNYCSCVVAVEMHVEWPTIWRVAC